MTMMVDVYVSAAAVSASTVQSLDALVSGGIVPVQVFVTVWPMVEGTVTLSPAGVAALSASIISPILAMKRRALIAARAVTEEVFFFIMIESLSHLRSGILID